MSPVTVWRRMDEEPPQIPGAPIELMMVANRGTLYWKPLGIYRETFYSVTGRWE